MAQIACLTTVYAPEEILLKLNAAYDLLEALQRLCGWCGGAQVRVGVHPRGSSTLGVGRGTGTSAP